MRRRVTKLINLLVFIYFVLFVLGTIVFITYHRLVQAEVIFPIDFF